MTAGERIRILKKLDVEAARPTFLKHGFPQARNDVTGLPMSEDDVILASMHKARLTMPKIFTGAEKAASRQWLYDHHMVVAPLSTNNGERNVS